MLEDLKRAIDILEGIPYWLDCGTLLFIIRENRLDPEDLDISIDSKYIPEFFSRLHLLLSQGFKIHNIYSPPTIGITEISFRRDGRAFDVFFRYKQGENSYGISWYDQYVYWKSSCKYTDELSVIEFDGENYFIPNHPEKYLAEHYGNWRVPSNNWHWSKAPCICEEICLR